MTARMMLAVAVVLFIPAAHAEDAVSLKLALRPGDVFYVETKNVTSRDPDPQIPNDTGSVTFLTETEAYEIEAVDRQGNMTMKVTYLTVLYDGGTKTSDPQMLGGRVIYDSTRPPAVDDAVPLPVVRAAASVGKSITVVLAPNGTAREVKGMEPIRAKIEDIIDHMPRLQESTKTAWKKDFGSKATNRLMRDRYRGMYPDKPVRVGDTWQKAYDESGFHIEHTYTLKERKDGSAFVEQKSTFRQDDGNTHTNLNGIIEIDEQTGWINTFTLHTESFSTTVPGKTDLISTSEYTRGPMGTPPQPAAGNSPGPAAP